MVVEVVDGDYPRTRAEFEVRFSTEWACREHPVQLRWSDDFACPRCEVRTHRPAESLGLRRLPLPLDDHLGERLGQVEQLGRCHRVFEPRQGWLRREVGSLARGAP